MVIKITFKSSLKLLNQIWLGWSSVKIVFHSPLSIHDGLNIFYLSFAALFSQNKLKF